ncbi:MAG: hypothetical protein QXW40_07650, partial [Thermofilum sp.]
YVLFSVNLEHRDCHDHLAAPYFMERGPRFLTCFKAFHFTGELPREDEKREVFLKAWKNSSGDDFRLPADL